MMTNKIKISEIFQSIQGEGRYSGFPMLFIRCSRCTRKCDWCDSSYHIRGKWYDIKQIFYKIQENNNNIICFTGGEPLLQKEYLFKLIKLCGIKYSFHLETNGDLIKTEQSIFDILDYFDYICISPKDINTANRIYNLFSSAGFTEHNKKYDIKIVTDLDKVNTNLLKFSTIIMPLTTSDIRKNKKIQQKVWNYCTKNNIRFGTRLHVETWGIKTRKK